MSNPLQFMEEKCGSIYRMKQVLVHSTREQDDNARTANQRHIEFWRALREQTGKNVWVHGNANPNLSQPEFERLRAIWNFASLRVIRAATRGRALDMLVRDKRVTGVYERQGGAA